MMDLNVHAFRLVHEATDVSSAEKHRKRATSKRGGLIGGKARAAALSPEKRKEIAVEANRARWAQEREALA